MALVQFKRQILTCFTVGQESSKYSNGQTASTDVFTNENNQQIFFAVFQLEYIYGLTTFK